MRHSFDYNGSPKLRLFAENALEQLLLETMAEASEKGSTTLLALPKPKGNEFVLTVGDKA